jgi:methylated-DNA-protein-cysteine methyltransferase-like protein
MGDFSRILDIVSRIPEGKVTTYGTIAKYLGLKSSRIVGFALHTNKDPIEFPCHRVVNRFGKLAPGYAFGGPDKQRKRLEREGVIINSDNCIDLDKYLWAP